MKYHIYIGRKCVDRFTSDTIAEATDRWDAIADTLQQAGTCTLYQGRRSVENQCAKLIIKNP